MPERAAKSGRVSATPWAKATREYGASADSKGSSTAPEKGSEAPNATISVAAPAADSWRQSSEKKVPSAAQRIAAAATAHQPAASATGSNSGGGAATYR